jgi:hypothetical protein
VAAPQPGHEGPAVPWLDAPTLDEPATAAELDAAADQIRQWNGSLTPGPCAWPTCPRHGWRHR